MSVTSLCPACSSPLAEGSRFCASCGRAVPPSTAAATVNVPHGVPPGADPGGSHRAGAARLRSDKGRFLPGMILAGRYRIMGLLGSGGMGEVYRADDLKLGQPVALKFLPAGLEADPDRLQRLLAEVRTARQVAHPNVCRIYDAGEADGHHFLSMEYVDGEDLASLLRRIGRLPKDKAIQIARQLCAGLAASHEIGLLHRDLKPANVMIDGRGRARITDFGLAAFAEEIGDVEVRSGTPAYMAPEQLAGREVTVRSDLYALGLVLYELFTGKPAFAAATVEEQRRLQTETTPSSPSSLVEGFDPAVERVILRCLDPDPARRPASALSVAAALPGGDPIAAALAAGETPSPEMVAEAGGAGGASPAFAIAGLGVFLAALAACLALAPRATVVGATRLPKPPVILQERAREILATAGYDREPADSLYVFSAHDEYLSDVRRRVDAGEPGWRILREGPASGIVFHYRQSPKMLGQWQAAAFGNWSTDPPDTTPGMAHVVLDPGGRLLSLLAVPGERIAAAAPAAGDSGFDWEPLLRATGIEPASLAPAPPEWAPPVFADARAAWTGSLPGHAGAPLRVEAASAGRRPVWLRVIGPWSRPAEEPPPPENVWARAGEIGTASLFPMVTIVAGVVALRNVRRGRGDRRGALRLALYLGGLRMLWYLGAHHVPSREEFVLFVAHLSYAMQRVGLAYVFYLAIEPYVRRLWPSMLASWVRVLEGRLRDPLVGTGLLVGCATGALNGLAGRLVRVVPEMLGGPPAMPALETWNMEALRGPFATVLSVIAVHTTELLNIIFPMTLLLIFRLVLRRTDLAVAAVWLVALMLFHPGSGSTPAYVILYSLISALNWFVLFRFGLLSTATGFTIAGLIGQIPLTWSPAPWYAGAMLLALAFVVAPALWGFWTSLAGRPLFHDAILEPAAPR